MKKRMNDKNKAEIVLPNALWIAVWIAAWGAADIAAGIAAENAVGIAMIKRHKK